MRLGLYVGSFNPVHNGHVKIVDSIIKNKYVDKVFIIPTKNYWHKNSLVSIEHRVNMLKFFETDNIIIHSEYSDLEYTYQIIEKLKEKYKNDSFYLIIGADNIINFDKWMKYEELLKLNLIIINRDGIDIKYYLNKLKKLDKFIIMDIKNIDISSTKIRENINNKRVLKNYLNHNVIDYIYRNKLYDCDFISNA